MLWAIFELLSAVETTVFLWCNFLVTCGRDIVNWFEELLCLLFILFKHVVECFLLIKRTISSISFHWHIITTSYKRSNLRLRLGFLLAFQLSNFDSVWDCNVWTLVSILTCSSLIITDINDLFVFLDNVTLCVLICHLIFILSKS